MEEIEGRGVWREKLTLPVKLRPVITPGKFACIRRLEERLLYKSRTQRPR